MRFDELERIHEELGDEYLATMKSLGVEFPPPVAWCTHPPVPAGRTMAVVFLDDEREIEVHGVPRDMLVSAVVRQALSGCHVRNDS